MPLLSTDSRSLLLTDSNDNVAAVTVIWKSWVKPFTLFSLSSIVSIVTSPLVLITNYWKETAKFDFVNGWNIFIVSPNFFIFNELINSFFTTLSYFSIEFFLNTIISSSLISKEKLKKVSKSITLTMLLLLTNEIVKNIISKQFSNSSNVKFVICKFSFYFWKGNSNCYYFKNI